jgi:hypothetical protein
MRLASLATLALAGCVLGTGPSGPFADVVGTWTYVGEQTSPALQITGTLTISDQDDDLILGSLAFTTDDGLGGIQADGGAVTGRVIELSDVDFDVLLGTGDRRHVAHISANGDTLSGLWTQAGSGASGEFVATRNAP